MAPTLVYSSIVFNGIVIFIGKSFKSIIYNQNIEIDMRLINKYPTVDTSILR